MSNETASQWKLSIEQIRQFLPHRAPFLLVDRVLEIHTTGPIGDLSPTDKVGTRVVALKNVTFNEPFFQGHFPTYSIMPGVLIVEAMAQAASFGLYPHLAAQPGGIEQMAKDFQCILLGVDGARFRRPVVPGDSLRLEARVSKTRGMMWGFECSASVDGQKVAEAELLANLITKKQA